MNIQEFIGWVEQNASRVHEYKSGGDGTGGKCDCIGLVIGALRLSGMKWPWTHGSNYAARYRTRNLAADRPLNAGDLVYKARAPGEAKYNLPKTYMNGPDRNDYYHVGVVTSTNPLRIMHCTSVKGGMKVDTTRGTWKYSGQMNLLDAEEEKKVSTLQAIVHAENGKPVKLRAKADQNCNLYTEVKVGTAVEVIGASGEWVHVRYGGREGYMMEKYLTVAQEAQETENSTPIMDAATLDEVIVSFRAQLLTIKQGVEMLEIMLDQLQGKGGAVG